MSGRNRGRGRRTVRGRASRSMQAEVSRLRREIKGFAITPRSLGPPKINLRPWYPLVVEKNFENPLVQYDLTLANLTIYIVQQLGLTSQASANMVVRLQEIRFWATQQGADSQRVAVYGEVASLIPTISDRVSSAPSPPPPAVHYPVAYKFRDTGSLDEPASAGYKWPIAQQQTALYRDSDFVFSTVASNVGNFTCHIHVLWSTAEIMPPVPSVVDSAVSNFDLV